MPGTRAAPTTGMQVHEVMTRAVLAVSRETRPEVAARMLIGARISGAPVIGPDNRPIGVISLVDLADPDRGAAHAGELIQGGLITAHAHEPLEVVAERMLDAGVRRLPVVDLDGHLIGIVSATDVLRGLVRMVR